jgi:MFS family permease
VYVLLATGDGVPVWLVAVVAVALLVGFVRRQSGAANPLLPLRLLSSRGPGLGNLVQAMMVAGLFGFQFLGVLYLQQLLGYDPLRAGLAFLPVPVVVAVVSLGVTARLGARVGLRPVLVAGLTAVTLGLALLTGLPAQGAYLQHVLPARLLIGAGFGLAFPVLAAIAVGGAPTGDAGIASGLFNTTQQVGGALGLALLTHVATLSAQARGPGFTLGGYHLTFGVAAGLSAVALLLALPAPAACAAGTPLDSPEFRSKWAVVGGWIWGVTCADGRAAVRLACAYAVRTGPAVRFAWSGGV